MPQNKQKRKERAIKGTAQENRMTFFTSAVGVLQKLVIGLGAVSWCMPVNLVRELQKK